MGDSKHPDDGLPGAAFGGDPLAGFGETAGDLGSSLAAGIVLPSDMTDEEHAKLLDAAGLEVFEITGTIKWFDASKGYGFVVSDNGGEDILLHVTVLRAGGYQTAHEGARVHCQVLRRPKGLQAFQVLSIDESTAVHPSQIPQRTHVVVKPESDWQRAMVKWFNRVRGFGFLTRGEGTEDVFVHMETLRRFGFTELRPGQIVQVRWGRGEKGCMAAELRPDGISKLPKQH